MASAGPGQAVAAQRPAAGPPSTRSRPSAVPSPVLPDTNLVALPSLRRPSSWRESSHARRRHKLLSGWSVGVSSCSGSRTCSRSRPRTAVSATRSRPARGGAGRAEHPEAVETSRSWPRRVDHVVDPVAVDVGRDRVVDLRRAAEVRIPTVVRHQPGARHPQALDPDPDPVPLAPTSSRIGVPSPEKSPMTRSAPSSEVAGSMRSGPDRKRVPGRGQQGERIRHARPRPVEPAHPGRRRDRRPSARRSAL